MALPFFSLKSKRPRKKFKKKERKSDKIYISFFICIPLERDSARQNEKGFQ